MVLIKTLFNRVLDCALPLYTAKFVHNPKYETNAQPKIKRKAKSIIDSLKAKRAKTELMLNRPRNIHNKLGLSSAKLSSSLDQLIL